MFGFNHPNPGVRDDGLYGYEVRVTIPDDMEVPEPLVKKKFDGGLFDVTAIKFPEFQYWSELGKWAAVLKSILIGYIPHIWDDPKTALTVSLI